MVQQSSDFRRYKKAVVPRFSINFMKNAICYRDAVLWNFISDYFKDSCSFKQFHRKVQSDPTFREILIYQCIKITKVHFDCHIFTFKSDYPFDVFYAFFFVG